MFNNDEVQAILDFVSIITAPVLQSIAFACDRFSRDEKEMIIFLKGYEKLGEFFSEEQIKLIPFYVMREALCRINYVIKSYFFNREKISVDRLRNFNSSTSDIF